MNIIASTIKRKYKKERLPDPPDHILITTPPTKLTYEVGETIDITGMVVTAYNSDDSVWGVVPSDEITIDPATALTSATTIIVTWNNGVEDLTDTFDITVEPARLPMWIWITHMPNKLTYEVGETIDITGMTVEALYEDYTFYGDVPLDELTISPTVAESAGTTTVQVTWHRPVDGEATSTYFNITVE